MTTTSAPSGAPKKDHGRAGRNLPAAVASAVVLLTLIGTTLYFWKTAFDERFAALSPGVQLALELTEVQLADPGVTTTDSCAAPDHPMIDRLWPDRMALVDVMIDLHPDEPASFRTVHAI